MTTIAVHRVRTEDDSTPVEASMTTAFLNSGNEVLRIGPHDRVVPWKEIERVVSDLCEDEVIVVRKLDI